jgi:hypothetical protein
MSDLDFKSFHPIEVDCAVFGFSGPLHEWCQIMGEGKGAMAP